MKRTSIQVVEGRRVPLPPEIDTLRVREQLLKAGETDLGSVFRSRGGSVFAKNLVGVVDIGKVQVRILPKISEASTPDEDEAGLLQMLLQSGVLAAATSKGSTDRDGSSLVEALIRGVAEHIYHLLILGPPRRYYEHRELSTTIRGRVDIQRLAYRRPAMEHLMPVRHFPLQVDSDLTRLVRALTRQLTQLTYSWYTRKLLTASDDVLAEVSVVPLTKELIARIELTRFEQEWTEVLELARLIASQRTPDATSPGKIAGFTLVFSLHNLFEKVLRRALHAGLSETRFSLHPPRLERQLLRREDGVKTLSIRPDLLFASQDEERGIVLIADAKWKRLEPSQDNLGIDPRDIYQMVTYLTRLGLGRGVLLFPARRRVAGHTSRMVQRYSVLPANGLISIVEVDVRKLISRDRELRRAAERSFAAEMANLALM